MEKIGTIRAWKNPVKVDLDGAATAFPETYLNPLSANPTKYSNTFKQFVDKLLTNCLSVFDHFVGLVFKGLRQCQTSMMELSCEKS